MSNKYVNRQSTIENLTSDLRLLTSPERGRSRGFTLAEMLVVVAIIGIMLVALVPAVTSLSKAGGRRAARDSLLGGIEQARTEAIKSGQPTYVVFPTAVSSTDPNIIQRYSYHSYAIFQDDPLNPATPKQIIGWKALPIGVSLRSAISSWSSASFTFTPIGSPQSFPYLKFNSAGEVESPTPTPAPSPTPTPGPVQLQVFEGYVDVTQNAPEVVTGAKDINGNPLATETINVWRSTGRAEPAQPTATP